MDIFVFKATKKTSGADRGKCRCTVDIAYKRAVLYVWLPEVKKCMYAQIVIDCQTQKETVSCEYCIVKENCHLRMELGDKTGTVGEEESPSSLLVPLLLMRV
ncbi:MAG: hypothetical protein M1167_02830 [Chloroflexi bacterium]|nr:hypothetical protein [Chloroflexota bacterium]